MIKKKVEALAQAIIYAENAAMEARFAEFEMLDNTKRDGRMSDDDYLRWVQLHPDLTPAVRKRMMDVKQKK